MHYLEKFDDYLTRIEEYTVALLLFVMTFAIFMSVVERFLIQLGWTWVEEFARYLSVWAAFIGSGLAAKKGAHIGIEAFVQILPIKIRKVEVIAVYAIGFLFSVAVFWIGISFLFKLNESGQLSPALGIPITWAYAAVPVGFALMGIHYFIKLIVGVSELFLNTDVTKVA